MQIELQLTPSGSGVLAYDHHHELSAAIYHSLSQSFPVMAHELHDGCHKSRMKLFVFSPLSSEPKPVPATLPNGAAAICMGERVWMRFASIWPELVFNVAEALQKAKMISIRGQTFSLTSLNMVPTPEFQPTMTYRPFGQAGNIVCRYGKDGKTFFQLPDDSEKSVPSCCELIVGNLRHKLLRMREVRPDLFANLVSIGGLDADAIMSMPITAAILPVTATQSFKTKLIRIKDLNVRGFRAPVRISAPEAVHRIIWSAGLGSMNSQGFGLVEKGRD